MIIERVLRDLDTPDDRHQGGNPLRGSRLGRCARQSAYMLWPDAYPPEPLSARAKLVFRFGDLIHEMIRRQPMKRATERMKRRKPLARAPKKRRALASVLRAFHEHVFARSYGRCAVPWCVHRADDAHHVVKRSQGGTHDPRTNGVALCRIHHEQTDYPYKLGRLVVVNLAPERFDFCVTFSKRRTA